MRRLHSARNCKRMPSSGSAALKLDGHYPTTRHAQAIPAIARRSDARLAVLQAQVITQQAGPMSMATLMSMAATTSQNSKAAPVRQVHAKTNVRPQRQKKKKRRKKKRSSRRQKMKYGMSSRKSQARSRALKQTPSVYRQNPLLHCPWSSKF